MLKSFWNWITCKDCIDCHEDKDDGVLNLNLYPAIPLPKTGPVTVTPSDSGAGGKFSMTVSGCEGQSFTYTPKFTMLPKVGDVYYRPLTNSKFIVTKVCVNYFHALFSDGETELYGITKWDLERRAFEILSRNQRVIVGVEND